MLRIILSSNFELIPSSILSALDGNKTDSKIAKLNESLNLLDYKVILVKGKNQNSLLLVDLYE